MNTDRALLTGRLHTAAVAAFSRLKTALSKLGWLYLGGLGGVVVLLSAMGTLIEGVLEDGFRPVNTQILHFLQSHANPTLDGLAVAASQLGTHPGTAVLAAPILAWFWVRKRKAEALMLVAALVGGAAISSLLKFLYQLPRPDLFPTLLPAAGYSFPSGHALISVCLYGTLAGMWVVRHPKRPWAWVGAAGLLSCAAVIWWSRLYLAVHWPTDVLGGVLAGSLWSLTCALGVKPARMALKAGRSAKRLHQAEVQSAQLTPST